MEREFQRVAMVNRSEAAMRFINAVREFNHENGTALRTIALYTEPDRRALFVREADEAVNLGPATFVDDRDGERKNTYLNYARLKEAFTAADADAVWAGWGFVSEDPEFADLCHRMGIVSIGPTAEAMRRLGDKISAKQIAAEAGIPVVPWSRGAVQTAAEARAVAERMGYPLLIKPAAGWGGRGLRKIQSAEEVAEAFEAARSEALRAFGNPTLFLERCLEGVRHIEVQILADHHGTTWAVGVRDCTIQRLHQKLLAESPAPTLTGDQDLALREAAIRLCRMAGYQSAGTVEFLYDPKDRSFAFLEVNPGLQVEHSLTEATTGLDLVKLQLHIVRGGRLLGDPPAPVGHAIGVHLMAEHPDTELALGPGSFVLFRLPTRPGLRIDRGVALGDVVVPAFDSMIANVIAHGHNRTESLSRIRRALLESAIFLQGGTNNKAILLDVLAQPEVGSAEVGTAWLDDWIISRRNAPRPYAAVALLQAALEAYDAEFAIEQARFYDSAARMRPEVGKDAGHRVEFWHRGQHYTLMAFRLGPHEYRVEADGRRIYVRVDRLGEFERWLTVGGVRHRVVSVAQGIHSLIEVDGVPHRFTRGDLGIVRALAPAVVVSVTVKAGDQVAAGDRLAVLEAMKMEMPVLAPYAGRVRQVHVMNNVYVAPGAPLVQIDPVTTGESHETAGRIGFDFPPPTEASSKDGPARLRRILDAIRRVTLGFDADPVDVKRLTADYVKLLSGGAAADADRRRIENEILGIFTDVSALFGRQNVLEDPDYVDVLSTGEYFLTYLRTLDPQTAGLPERFVEQLRRTLAHYGVDRLDRTPELKEALLWIYRSRQRVELQVQVVLAILQHRLSVPDTQEAVQDPGYRVLLDRLIAVAEERFPSLGDVARELRYRTFDRPLFERERRRVYDEAEVHLAYLLRAPEAPDRQERLAALVECPQPLQSLLMGRFEQASALMRAVMLEVLSRRYYRIRHLESFRSLALGDQGVGLGQYFLEGKRIRLLTTHALDTDLFEAAGRLGPLVAEIQPDEDVVIDFYVWRNGPLGDLEGNLRELKALLERVSYDRPIRRIVVALAGPGVGLGMGGMQHFTFRPSANGYEEDRRVRGLHPMIGKRLRLGQLANFEIERLPSVEDVYLFRGMARENPKDQRLFALAEVRDLTPIRDASGKIVRLPHLERMLMEALDGIRAFQAQRRPEERLHWNRVFLYVWPAILPGPEALDELVLKLGPATEGLGLEQVNLRARMPRPGTGELEEAVLSISNVGRGGFALDILPPSEEPIRPLTEYEQKVVRMRQRGMIYPYEIIRMLTRLKEGTRDTLPTGEFQEFDLNPEGRLVPVNRPYGLNRANVVVGVVKNFTRKLPEGMTRVILLGDPSREIGSTAEPECRRILEALRLAEAMRVPMEWFAVSAGAKISMESGVENMDWIARVLRGLIELTQGGGEVNIIVCGINVGGQSYWNAEATMLMHTRGILVMTQDGAMVLTGKTALDYSGGVSAEDNFGIGGYERVMGPNGQAQYWARDIDEACRILFRHYDYTYVVPGERFPRRAVTADPYDRDVCSSPHARSDPDSFARVGEVFSHATNPVRKRPFNIRSVMAAAIDRDHPPLERWTGWRDAEVAVVWDAHLGGHPVCLLGIESRPLARVGFVPTDGPDTWTPGTLFPQSSKKIARAINAASGNRPLVILANLSGFDGAPESMRKLQLEYGAEIGRAIVNFTGPIIFCVISRYHGGAFVVFSKPLNDNIEAAALEGAFASVIGGAPAAAVVFAREVDARTRKDPRMLALEMEISAAGEREQRELRARLHRLQQAIRSEKLGEVAEEFDVIHSVQRAMQVGSLDRIIPPATLRPYLIEAVERGMARELKRWENAGERSRIPG